MKVHRYEWGLRWLRQIAVPLTIATLGLIGCGPSDPEAKFRKDPFHAYEVAEKCSSGPGMPRTEYDIRWPGECLAAEKVVDQVFTREFYLADIELAMKHLKECRVAESVSHDALYTPCKAVEQVVLEKNTLGHFLTDARAAEQQLKRCLEDVWGREWREYYPEICARAVEAIYGFHVGPQSYSFHSVDQVDRQSAALKKALEWAPIRAARDGQN